VGLIFCGVSAGVFLRTEQIEALDEQLMGEAHLFFGEVSRHQGPFDWGAAEQVRQLLPLTLTERYVEVVSDDGRTLYRSANFGSHTIAKPVDGLCSIEIGENPVRLGVFHKNELTLHLAADLDEVDADTKRILLGFAVGLPLLLATVAVGAWWIARKALAPVRDITAAAERITAEHLDQRLPITAVRDEIGALSTVLNAMLDRLDKSFRQAMRFSADASHELKTPLTLLRASIEDLLESSTLSPPDHEAISNLLEQTRRLSSITESLLLLSRADAGQLRLDLKESNVADVIDACADDAAIMAEGRRISIDRCVPRTLLARVDTDRLTQILLNLLDNSIKYNHDGGRIGITGEMEGSEIAITVTNTGPGIPPEHAAQLFERFFRSSPSPDLPGHGLGLSLARELARAHRGDVELIRSDTEWTVLRVRLGV
jgi:signal transduction histidine kinase